MNRTCMNRHCSIPNQSINHIIETLVKSNSSNSQMPEHAHTVALAHAHAAAFEGHSCEVVFVNTTIEICKRPRDLNLILFFKKKNYVYAITVKTPISQYLS